MKLPEGRSEKSCFLREPLALSEGSELVSLPSERESGYFADENLRTNVHLGWSVSFNVSDLPTPEGGMGFTSGFVLHRVIYQPAQLVDNLSELLGIFAQQHKPRLRTTIRQGLVSVISSASRQR